MSCLSLDLRWQYRSSGESNSVEEIFGRAVSLVDHIRNGKFLQLADQISHKIPVMACKKAGSESLSRFFFWLTRVLPARYGILP